ncbi:MAG: SMC-Scp complex subunit ScpB [Ruminococcaceae bacterium]|nr:SMC-Scp complex subunit ScpB [Oscillospiraceae bacterium]
MEPQAEALQPLKNIEGAIEAILYAAGYPVKYAKLAEVLGLDVRNTKTVIQHMSTEFNSEKSKRGVLLLMFEDTCQFCTKEQYAPYIREALGIRRGGNLSASSMEVLAVIAYNQPVTRSFVDQVRGVDSSYAFNSLIDKGLIEACGRLDAPGRPMLYVTTEKFLRVFGITSLSELPATETMLPAKEAVPMVEQEGEDAEGGVTSEEELADEAPDKETTAE